MSDETITNLQTQFQFRLSLSQAGPLPPVLRGGPVGDGERGLRRRDGDPDGDAVPHAGSAHRRNGLLLPHVSGPGRPRHEAHPRPSIHQSSSPPTDGGACSSERKACPPKKDEWKSLASEATAPKLERDSLARAIASGVKNNKTALTALYSDRSKAGSIFFGVSDSALNTLSLSLSLSSVKAFRAQAHAEGITGNSSKNSPPSGPIKSFRPCTFLSLSPVQRLS